MNISDNDWINIKKTDIYPPFPNRGEQYMAFDGQWQQPAFFHIDPETGEKWWESQDGFSIKKKITHWRKMFPNPND